MLPPLGTCAFVSEWGALGGGSSQPFLHCMSTPPATPQKPLHLQLCYLLTPSPQHPTATRPLCRCHMHATPHLHVVPPHKRPEAGVGVISPGPPLLRLHGASALGIRSRHSMPSSSIGAVCRHIIPLAPSGRRGLVEEGHKAPQHLQECGLQGRGAASSPSSITLWPPRLILPQARQQPASGSQGSKELGPDETGL